MLLEQLRNIDVEKFVEIKDNSDKLAKELVELTSPYVTQKELCEILDLDATALSNTLAKRVNRPLPDRILVELSKKDFFVVNGNLVFSEDKPEGGKKLKCQAEELT